MLTDQFQLFYWVNVGLSAILTDQWQMFIEKHIEMMISPKWSKNIFVECILECLTSFLSYSLEIDFHMKRKLLKPVQVERVVSFYWIQYLALHLISQMLIIIALKRFKCKHTLYRRRWKWKKKKVIIKKNGFGP